MCCGCEIIQHGQIEISGWITGALQYGRSHDLRHDWNKKDLNFGENPAEFR